MKVAIQVSEAEEIKALAILLRHSPGMILRDQTYVISADASQSLREAGINFTEVCDASEGDRE